VNAPARTPDLKTQSWYESTARQRLHAFVDPRSFEEFIGPEQREISPHLKLFDLPEQFDDGMIVGRARLNGAPVLVAAQEGWFMGGAFGEVHGAKLTGLLRAAAALKRDVLILFDTGGVRLQEANAGELAIAEIMRAGCYGGGSLIAGCCSTLVAAEQGRISVSGPEVIETNKGVEEFDSKDRALVWRTMGGKHRYLIGGADLFVADTVKAFRDAALEALARPARLDRAILKAEQARLERRLNRFGAAVDAKDIWRTLGFKDVEGAPAMPADEFLAEAHTHRETADEAR
jgi:malonate decarboxylase beta subunit